ncbi:acetolactate synthase III, large subunit [uncultured spirochete]|jgi:acetolactate synthase, large subunit, biosynthetic type|uniref:Acetolactate synthase n=1 Tax=uncultured spirochete TaxID=156406 RepID=A0A3P3XJR1_9SPIR|nr:biosynthetic-type acetolactate synthase large subunit [Rectinema subterraneum]SLM14019.1 acetolactate synthase III, large subunit [uncultured spirochete]
MEYTGARILMESLLLQSVDTVFGYPGGSVLYIYDELYRYRDRIRHILTSHEQHAAHAADGYARSTGKTGVCIATSGPGATNLVTGIATAHMDSVPLVAITGNVATSLLGKDSFQEVDIYGITMPIIKHNWIVKNVEDLAEVVREAFFIARSGRPGPVLIDIPKDVTIAKTEWQAVADANNLSVPIPGSAMLSRRARLSSRNEQTTFSDKDIDQAITMIETSERPFVYAGGGVIASNACEELRELIERIKAPVALSLMGISCLPPSHPLYTGLIGMHGSVASNRSVQEADLILAVGARFSDRVVSRADSFASQAKILQLDIDPAEINKNIQTEHHIIGDLKLVLSRILGGMKSKQELTPPSLAQKRAEWLSKVEAWKSIHPEANFKPSAFHPRFIIETVAQRLGEDAIVATDVGQHQIWTAQFYPFAKPRTFLSSCGLGTMGSGLGFAIGAKTAHRERPVVLFTGDGSFRMNCGELATAVNYHLPILIVILNNRTLGMVRQWQTLFYDERYAETTLDKRPPDFVRLAEAYGAAGFRADSKVGFLAALDEAMAHIAEGRPAVIDALIDQDEQVLPMVPGGKAIDEQIM